MTIRSILPGMILAALFAVWDYHPAADPTLRVVDRVTRRPIANAIVTAGGVETRTDSNGIVRIPEPVPDVIRVRAYGYLRAESASNASAGSAVDIPLTPFRPKALYLSVYGIGDNKLRTAALKVLDTTDVNGLVIDLKGDRGIVPYRSAVPLGERVGAQKVITIKDLPGLIASLHEGGLYTIARIVVFKDDLLATGRPDLAVRRRDGAIFRDGEHLSWTDPYNREVWEYNIAIAVEAARAGFDEIQFDYVRLPDAKGLAFPMPDTELGREAPIEGFLNNARKALTPFNVFTAVDVFGYVCWNPDDTGIGQQLEHLVNTVDYISPLLYPSSFQFGIPGYRDPIQQPYEVIRFSLERAVTRTHVPAVRFRPWLQAFRDYAFGGRAFARTEIQAQIKAADDVQSDGWMLWNPRNQYAGSDLTP